MTAAGRGRDSAPPGVSVRPMRREDAEAVAGLAGQLGYPSTPEQIKRRLADVERRGPAVALVAEGMDGVLVGWIHVSTVYGLVSEPHAEIGGLVVDEAARGGGVGRVLMAAAEQWAVAQNLREVALRSNVIRDGAHAFYRGLGYECPKTQHKFRKTLASYPGPVQSSR